MTKSCTHLLESIIWADFTKKDFINICKEEESGTYGFVLIKNTMKQWYIAYIEYDNQLDYGDSGIRLELHQYDNVLHEAGGLLTTVYPELSIDYDDFQDNVYDALEETFFHLSQRGRLDTEKISQSKKKEADIKWLEDTLSSLRKTRDVKSEDGMKTTLIKEIDWAQFSENDLQRLNRTQQEGNYGYVRILTESRRWFLVFVGYESTGRRKGIVLSVKPYNFSTGQHGDSILKIKAICSASDYSRFQNRFVNELVRSFWREMIDPRRKRKIERLAGRHIDLEVLKHASAIETVFSSYEMYLTVVGALKMLEKEIVEGKI